MKKLLSMFVTVGVLLLAQPMTSAFADDKPAAAAESAKPAADSAKPAADSAAPAAATAAPAAAATAAPAAAAPAAAAPTPNKGDNAWMIVATALVIMMSIPGLALFYGGLVRSKNMLSVLTQVFVIFSVVVVLWTIYGYSLAFTEGNAFIGGTSRLMLGGIFDVAKGTFATAATFSKGVVIPEYLYFAFQATFAAITVCLIIGSFAERVKFSGLLLFSVLWFTFSYLPIAHMVWFWQGPDAYKDVASGAAADATAGWLFQKGILDFAGGTVVHINAGIAGLVGAIVIGKRVGFGKESMAPHSLTLTMVGASLLWVGWFGFNAGSALEAADIAALAFVNTFVATAMATLSWLFAEWLLKGKPSLLGACSGAVAGLVAITPACGFVGPGGALAIGLLVGLICLWGVNGLKRLIGADDSLDVFGVHCIGGIFGAIATGVFAAPMLGGQGVYDYVNNKVADFDMGHQVWVQFQGVMTSLIWSGVVALVCYMIVKYTIGLRVSEEDEREGLDIASHGESAYHA